MGSPGVALVACWFVLLAAAVPYYCPECDKEPPADHSALLFRPGCRAPALLTNCSSPGPDRCHHDGHCPAGGVCCPAAGCPGLGVCRPRSGSAAAAGALADRQLGGSVTVCLLEQACREIGPCPAAASCQPACRPPHVCVLHRDEPRPRCHSADHLCQLYGPCAGVCPDLAGADEVRVECGGGDGGVACIVADGSPVCVKSTCPAGLTCYISELFGTECVDFHPCARTACPPGHACREQQVHCVRAPCPPLAVCELGGSGDDPLFPCHLIDCPDGEQCVLGAGGPDEPGAICIPSLEPCVSLPRTSTGPPLPTFSLPTPITSATADN